MCLSEEAIRIPPTVLPMLNSYSSNVISPSRAGYLGTEGLHSRSFLFKPCYKSGTPGLVARAVS